MDEKTLNHEKGTMRISRKKIYHALFEYCLTVKNNFYLAIYYDDVADFIEFVSKFIDNENHLKTYQAIQRAKTCLINNGWLYKFNSYADKQYIGEPAYIVNYRFPESLLRRYEIAKLFDKNSDDSKEVEEFLSSIPLS